MVGHLKSVGAGVNCSRKVSQLMIFLFSGKSETGAEYKNGVIKRILSADWRPESVVRIVALCKDLDLKEEEEKKLVSGCCSSHYVTPFTWLTT